MKLDWLTDPTDEMPPTGPDLEAADDDDFVARYFDAEGRLPERYFIPGLAPDGSEDRIFDPRDIDLGREGAWISALLRRSRDVRLLSLFARLAILAGRPDAFADTLDQIATLLETWPDEVHPQVARSAAERRGAIEALNTAATVVMPLWHLPVLPGTDVTLRRHMVASGRAEPRGSEKDLAGTDVAAPLRSDANLRQTAQMQAHLTRAADALDRIARTAARHPTAAFRPDLGAVRGAVADFQAMITAARPDLPGWSEQSRAGPETPQDTPEPADPAAHPGTPAAPARPAAIPLAIPDRPTALAALDAAETWLATHEPSSAALLLVTQARLLVGVPLVQAIETLMPADAPRAVLAIGGGTGFALPMDRLKSLSAAALERRTDAPAAPVKLDPIADRAALAACLHGVENHFSAREPTSPVPLLLSRAREILGRRFDAVVTELLASRPGPGEG